MLFYNVLNVQSCQFKSLLFINYAKTLRYFGYVMSFKIIMLITQYKDKMHIYQRGKLLKPCIGCSKETSVK
jgi:hypothetical protein